MTFLSDVKIYQNSNEQAYTAEGNYFHTSLPFSFKKISFFIPVLFVKLITSACFILRTMHWNGIIHFLNDSVTQFTVNKV